MPQGKYSDVIAKSNPMPPSRRQSSTWTGRVLGRHEGIWHYTIGQRRGIASPRASRIYVVHLDSAANRVIVARAEALATQRIHLRDCQLAGRRPAFGDPDTARHPRQRCARRARRRRPGFSCATGPWRWSSTRVETGVAPGQACVFYADESAGARVLGGGFIARSERSREAEAALRQLSALPAEACPPDMRAVEAGRAGGKGGVRQRVKGRFNRLTGKAAAPYKRRTAKQTPLAKGGTRGGVAQPVRAAES